MLRQTITEACGNLLASRQRSALALIGILIGASSVIAMLNVGGMAQNETAKVFQQMGTDIISIRSSNSSGFSPTDIAALSRASAGLSSVAPFAVGSSAAVYQGRALNPSIIGATQTFARIAQVRVREGRFISDFDRFEPFATIGSKFAETMGGNVSLGAEIRVGRYQLRVIGILDEVTVNPMLSVDINNAIIVSMANIKRLVPATTISTVVGRARPDVGASEVAQQLESYFSNRSDIEVQTAQQLIAGMANQKKLFQVLLGIIGGISLVLGGVGVMNIMLISVQERHREIGIRLAIGARRRDIQNLFLFEAIILAVLGGALGIVVGIAGSYAFAVFSEWDFVVAPLAAPLGAGVSIAVGVFFGFYPAVMASRLDPIVALRAE
ncbi:MAG: ABC transporter permease [Pseudolabrys sp.]|nr:ABC transporter permease [Pseudolabrys sp.]